MLKDYLFRRYICKLVGIVSGVVVLAFAAGEKLTAASSVFWMASPLVLLWLMEVGCSAEQRRHTEWSKSNPKTEGVPPWEGEGTGIARFARELVSLSLWPFYLTLFALIGFGGAEIAKVNRETATPVEQKTAAAASVPQPYRPGNTPILPVRPPVGAMPFTQMNSSTRRFTPAPFPTPSRFPMPNRPPAGPLGATLNASPGPATQNP